MENETPVCQGIKNKDTSLWVRAHSAKERCDATKEGFVRLCWCSKGEKKFFVNYNKFNNLLSDILDFFSAFLANYLAT